MCGIGGVFLHEAVSPDEAGLMRMADVMRWRGPDHLGTWCQPHIGLVHLRLSVRDLSPAGRCPMPSEDGSIMILLNGEIYNWQEVRSELRAAGYGFRSNNDSEVIANGYHAWGLDLIPRLRGMFALAIWDMKQRVLLLARDRVGEKPIYYRRSAVGLQFASSIEAVARVSDTEGAIDDDAMICYLSHGFVPATHTIWSDVSVLPPGCTLTIEPGKEPQRQRYWDFPRVAPRRTSMREAEKAIFEALDDSVARCLDADVPVGVFLSGGVDSSLVAALASRHAPGIPAFALGFREESHNELPYARRVAAHLGIPLHETVIDAHDVLTALPHLVLQYGQPFGDSSSVVTYLVSRLAREQVTVCLGGDGGDEAFGGYWRIQSGVYAHRYGRAVPRTIRRSIIPRLAPHLGAAGARLKAMNTLSLGAEAAGYTNSQSWYDQLSTIAGPRLLDALNHDAARCRTGKGLAWDGASVVQRLQFDDYQVQLPDAFLTKVDVASMAASLEVRSPFLDHTIIELAWSLPDASKMHWGQRKWLLKRIAAKLVPPDVIYREKMGFAPPMAGWMRRELGDVLEALMEDSRAVEDGYIDARAVREALSEHRAGRDHHQRLWMVLWLELWFRIVRHGQAPEQVDLPAIAAGVSPRDKVSRS